MIPLRSVAAVAVPSAAILLLGFVSACHTSAMVSPPERVSIVVPAPDATKGIDLPGLHNVVTYSPNTIGGSQPEGAEGLQSLAAMGVKTIITVDGAVPDVEGARRLGIRYVHLPISYDTVTRERQLQLAQAVTSCDGPIYMHCHHGKHRSSAALGSALVVCGALTPEQAKERMQASGLAKDYTGLWEAVATAEARDPTSLRVDPASFPSITQVTGMVATMSEIDQVFDLVKQAQQAGWRPPQDHPDLVPTKETQRLAKLFASLATDSESTQLPDDYQTLLGRAIDAAKQLDAAVQAGDATRAADLMTAMNKSCKQCHVVHRDR